MNYKPNINEEKLVSWIKDKGGTVKAKTKVRKINQINMNQLSLDYEPSSVTQELREEDAFVIEISLTDLEKLKDANKVYKQQLGANGAEMLEQFIEQQIAENKIRCDNPGVQEAYNEYTTLRNLANFGHPFKEII